MSESRLELRLPAGPQAPRQARHALSRFSGEVPPEVLENASLLVSELVTNSVRHAGLGQGSAIIMKVEMGRRAIRVEVFDEGPGFEPASPAPAYGQDSGWGLLLVRHVADRWGVSRDSMNGVWFEIDRRGNHMAAGS